VDETLRPIVLALLTTGGATFLWTVIKSVIAFRNSAEGREDKAIGRLERFEASCREQLAAERIWARYWYRRSAVLERSLLSRGVALPPAEPEPTADLGGVAEE
jgi:hypothetical protein